jgi:hypothetical protein
MVHVVPQWKIAFVYADRTVTFWLHNNHAGNILRTVADLQFSENGLEQPDAIQISRVEKPNPSTQISTSVVP